MVIGNAGAHQHRAHTGFKARLHVCIHAVTNHNRVFRVGADSIQRRTHHDRIWLAHVIRLAVGGGGNERSYGAGSWKYARGGGAGDIRVGGNKTRTIADEVNGGGNRLKGVSAGLAKYNEVRVIVGEDPARLVHGGGQAGFANYVGLAGTYLAGKKVCGSGSGGPDALCRDIQTGIAQACR